MATKKKTAAKKAAAKKPAAKKVVAKKTVAKKAAKKTPAPKTMEERGMALEAEEEAKLEKEEEAKRAEEWKNWKYTPLTEEEMQKYAVGLASSQLFCSSMIKKCDVNLITNIFMHLIFMDKEGLEAYGREGVIHFCEWYSEAGHRSINGYPMFMSCRPLNRKDVIELHDRAKRISDAMEAASKGAGA